MKVSEKFLDYIDIINPLKPNDPYRGRTAPLNFKRCFLYIYSTNTGTEYFNSLTPNDPYRGRTVTLTCKVAFYIFIQQI